ncbi:MAG TPA: hypothetical protein VKA70_16685 [Blastocatellia bacterium]|nr:hypothetical protein [Blastocatellia bacterium]
MSERAENEFRRSGVLLALWAGVLLAPFAFLLNLQISYALVPWACSAGQPFWLHVASCGSLLLSLLGLFTAWRNWQKAGRESKVEGGDPRARSRFMAMLGLLMSGLFSLVILAQWIADFIIDPCQF